MNINQSSTESRRLPWIDAARGIALLGILMVNVPAFHAPFFLYGGEEVYWDSSLDSTIRVIIDIFFQASFYTLFSFLFGFGLQMMFERLSEADKRVTLILQRRLTVLLFFGFLHAFLLWHGDILLSYGAIGFLMFFFFRRKAKTLVLWFIGLLVIPGILLTSYLYSFKDLLGGMNRAAIMEAQFRYKSDSILDVWKQNYADWMYTNGGMAFLFLTMALLPMFLIGAVFMKNKWLHDVQKHQKLLRVILFTSFTFFLVFKAGPYMFNNPAWLGFLQDHVGGAASSIFYVVAITLLYQTAFAKKLLSYFTYIGKMSLTNYISQSIICFFLFYGPGFNLYGEIQPLGSVIIVLSIFSFQVVVSKWWLSKYSFGPLEWVWRSLTYGKKQPMKKVRKQH
ncbi:uncharacterized protein HNQ94_001450 [Salirhabdus euzebyi]|uniref:DUF418 domain-containing protein n=1 Tax=Salirhabdus euzebyi TaxID=394506 RepID=A0A841Q3Q9_9BACI|nr:DUF418 domain-containing protein [Salirhabdus euzebyi]MBB6453002.1 uncharacterized protein [Salirhabdus euzebyi]